MSDSESIADKMNSLGLYDSKTFWEFYGKKKESGIADESELELLSPDNIDNTEFWIECDKRFIGSVCGVAALQQREMDKKEINWHNINFAHQLGVLNYLAHHFNIARANSKRLNVLEIGPGYGALVSQLIDTNYIAIDVNPRFDGVIKCDGNGNLPSEIADNKYDDIISSNVFQHLSIKQRRNYYKTAFNSLVERGILAFTCLCKPNHKIKLHNSDREFICHMGQYTELQTYPEILGDLTDIGFDIHSTTRRSDNSYCFHVGKPKESKESKNES